jgi:hypothetical protein
MKASLSLPDYASLIRPTVLPALKFRISQFDATKLRDLMAFQGHFLTVYLPPIEQSMPYDITSVGKAILR